LENLSPQTLAFTFTAPSWQPEGVKITVGDVVTTVCPFWIPDPVHPCGMVQMYSVAPVTGLQEAVIGVLSVYPRTVLESVKFFIVGFMRLITSFLGALYMRLSFSLEKHLLLMP